MIVIEITEKEFNSLKDLIFDRAGIHLTEVKKQLMISRLMRRLRKLEMESFSEYINYLETNDPNGDEFQELINRITTNKTDFFREDYHFEYLNNKILPLIPDNGKLNIWCAASSTGEEPFSLAIVFHRYQKNNGKNIFINFTASDISTEVLDKARNGVYAFERVKDISPELLHTYFLKGKGNQDGKVKVKKDLIKMIDYKQINLMDKEYPFEKNSLDIIFLRNVIIYFNKETKIELIDKLSTYLKKDGLLFLGHSESLLGINTIFKPIERTIYQLRD